MKEKKFKTALFNISWVVALLILAAVAMVKLYPESSAVFDNIVKYSVKLSVASAELEYIHSELSFFNIVNNEVENPLKRVEDSRLDLTRTDDDILKSVKAAKEREKTTKKEKGGDVIDRTYVKVENMLSYSNVKVQNRTKKSVDIKGILKQGANLKIDDISKPTVLIYHSHTCESYMTLDKSWWEKGFSPRSTDPGKNMIRVGDAICEQLELAGINVIHDETVYDSDYPNAYKNSGKGIQKILDNNPSIKVATDIHRDAVDSGTVRYKPVAEINSKRAAQLMIITGCEEDYIKDFPNWRQNLRFALNLQNKCEQMFPGLMRPVYFADRRYNMYKLNNSVLIEMGSDANTLEQAVYSGKMLGRALSEMLLEYV